MLKSAAEQRSRVWLLPVLLVVMGLVAMGGGYLTWGLSAEAQELDMDEIFPPSDPPEIKYNVLQACSTSCHSFVPLVVGQKTEEEWKGTFDRHLPYIEPFGFSQETIQAMLEYCQANFNPEKPVPELPDALLQSGWATQ